jgi:hypothetical protein
MLYELRCDAVVVHHHAMCGELLVMCRCVMSLAPSYPLQFGHFYNMLVVIDAWTA